MIVSDPLSLKLTDLFPSNGSFNSQFTGITPAKTELKAQQEWDSAIASIQQLLHLTIAPQPPKTTQGVVISSPTPAITHTELLSSLEVAVFSPSLEGKMILPACEKNTIVTEQLFSPINIPLQEQDSLKNEEFCLVLTNEFSCLLVKGINPQQQSIFNFSFDPDLIHQAWVLLRKKLVINYQYQEKYLQELINKFSPRNPDYKIVSRFSQFLLENLRLIDLKPSEEKLNKQDKKRHQSISLKKTPLPPYAEIELLQALTHEIRTPLTSIKTLTKLLQKKTKSSPDLTKYLEMIEQECTEQINRMDLIFRVAELEATPHKQKQVNLVPICLEQILNQTIPIWKRQAQRRNIVLDFMIPQKLPQVVSDPVILTQMLGGLMEKFTRNIPSGGHFQVLVLPAGNQLKLQFLSESNLNSNQVKCLGKLLLFQPETGSLSLNPDVTKHIFNVLGGKLIIKQKQDKGEVLTVFLPLGKQKKLTID
ncbi:HAMP domain-containing histidine kinase [Cyanobacterium stanieri LEGE 03274]|uniref:histidine kinase n=1 Tax=Cyanobacterium stanieri LEGE 03274 TaxID=1828756 RepID=A0ABR9V353_9CHRO|nr:HAMP domain-containing sensor histidine kinase [Cyanobacterium stanieri]MBE9222327.1 HAMP domain-containing histidine kinase [Cyanobacterium stanieri LEGE 03274]